MATPRRFISALVSGLALTATAFFGASTSAPQDADDLEPAFASTCIGYCQHPTNAAKVFRWGLEDWRDEFEVDPLTAHWKSNHLDLVNTQIGMLTIRARPNTGMIKVWPDNQTARYGRWEARVRAREFTTEGRKYTFNWELKATGAQEGCGRNIVLSSYKTDDEAAQGGIDTPSGVRFTYEKNLDLRSRAWHTYAVEVTQDHISWFVDTQVIHTERRPEALTGARFRPVFRIQGVEGEVMRDSWMQMDWVRYYTLKRPNAQPITAPLMNRVETGGCSY